MESSEYIHFLASKKNTENNRHRKLIDPLNSFNLPTPAYMVIWTLTFAYQVEGKKKYSIILFLASIYGNPHLKEKEWNR